MYFAQPFLRVATTILIVWMFSCGIALPQTVSTRGSTSASFLLAHLPSAPERCARSAGSSAVPRADADVAGDTPSSCGRLPSATPALRSCDAANRTGAGCDGAKDPVQAKLEAMGKAGQKISRAREKVLEILETENACSAWFRKKDLDPAATFRTLRFELDRRGDEFVRLSRDTESQYIYRNPYVARVGQDTGAFATITLNANGAFFRAEATTLEVPTDGGLFKIRGTRLMNVGQFSGDSLPAQMLALLHEFGHVINLLPVDFDNEDGKSVQNSREVLRYCLPEVHVSARKPTRRSGSHGQETALAF